MQKLWPLGALPALYLAHAACARSSSATETVADGGGKTQRSDAGVVEVPVTTEAGADDASSPLGVPAGWVPFSWFGNTDCHFYAPASTAALPPPLEWEPCPATTQPEGIVCDEVNANWQAPPNGQHVGWMSAEEWIQPDGTFTTAIARMMPGMTYYVVEDSNAVVHSALLAIDETLCKPSPNDIRDGRIVYSVYVSNRSGGLSEYGEGAMVSGIDDLQPRPYLEFGDQTSRGYVVGIPGVLEAQGYPTNVFILHDWSDPAQIVMSWSSAQDDGLEEIPSSFSGQALFWEAVADPEARLKVWTADAGVTDLVSFGSDTSQGAGDLGTDGQNLVWLQGSGRTVPYGEYPSSWFVTAPFTTNAADLQPRRIRSEPGGDDAGSGLGASLIQVGCGYAAREFPGGIRILRISDGVSWILPETASWQWGEAIAVTCTYFYGELLALSDAGWAPTIGRARLDSLGPGIPPD